MTETNNHQPEVPPTGWAHRFLRIFTLVHPGEAVTALLLTCNIFLLFLAYYIIKPVREGLILAGNGAEWKSYLSAVIAVLPVFVGVFIFKEHKRLTKERGTS